MFNILFTNKLDSMYNKSQELTLNKFKLIDQTKTGNFKSILCCHFCASHN